MQEVASKKVGEVSVSYSNSSSAAGFVQSGLADLTQTVAKYKILQQAEIYRGIALAAPQEVQERIVAAKAADELLNISGVDASIVVAPDKNGGSFVSARSIGDINVQIIMEKLGGGGNRSAAAAQFADLAADEAVKRVRAAIDDYLS